MYNELNAVSDALRVLLKNKINKHKGKIYHYTSPEGLLNILSSGKIWFSNIRFLNDKSENNYIYTLFPNNRDEFSKIKLDKDFFELINDIKNQYLKNDFCKIDEITFWSGHVFVSCFSVDKDNLSLWNYYTKNDKKVGYNICFDEQPFQFCQEYASYLYGKVIYDIKTQKELIKGILNSYNKFYISNKSRIKNTKCEISEDNLKLKFIKSFLDVIEIFNIFFKHYAYKFENEYRCALFDVKYNPLPSWRVCNGFFIPYLEEEYEKKYFSELGIKSTDNIEIFKNSLELFLNTKKYENINIWESKIPQRY